MPSIRMQSMHHHFENYRWKDGKPVGTGKTDKEEAAVSYKIVSDPYQKRFSIEKYHFSHFEKIIYDSLFFDFRHLHEREQAAWEKERIDEKDHSITHLLRNNEGRAILLESLFFLEGRCRVCEIKSASGILLATHQVCYEDLDGFNGVILFDIEKRPILKKTYSVDPITKEFTELLFESWEVASDGNHHFSQR